MRADITTMLTDAANRYGVPPQLAIAVAQQESGGDPNSVSSSGAQGVMQLMPATAADLGVSDPFDPAQNIDAGVRYLSQLLSQFSSPQLALAAYNWGPGHVARNGYQNWPAETVNYVSKILKNVGGSISDVFSSSGDDGGVTAGLAIVLVGLGVWVLFFRN